MRLSPLAVLLLAIFLVPGIAQASTYVMMSDEALADSAPLIVDARIEAVETATSRAGAYTDYQVSLLRVVKGSVPGSTLVVRVIGGETSSGMRLYLPGVPRFQRGQRALLFLTPRGDGTFTITQLMLGAFHEVQRRGQRVALRRLDGAQAIELESVEASRRPDGARDYEGFLDWLAARARGTERAPSYHLELPAAELENLHNSFTLFEVGGVNLRWPDFDGGGTVTFFAEQGGQPGVTGGGFNEFQEGLQAWTDDPGTNIDYQYGGTTPATSAFANFDGINAIAFDDPNNNPDFGGAFNCALGGVIAIGGPWFAQTTTHTWNGTTYISIQGADVVTNENVGCLLNANNAAAEVFGHELGHTLGIGHSCGDANSGSCDTTAKNEALMRAFAHADGRGSQLNSDDQGAAAALYGTTTGGVCVENATTLCLNDDRFRVETTWTTPNSNSGDGMAVELTPDTGYFWFFNQENVEMVIKVLDACSFSNRFWVFAGGLTNVEVELTVTDTQTGSMVQYTNPQSTPFQPIQDTNAFATCP